MCARSARLLPRAARRSELPLAARPFHPLGDERAVEGAAADVEAIPSVRRRRAGPSPYRTAPGPLALSLAEALTVVVPGSQILLYA
ncbi:hypothetical protein [Streptomyces sp. NPDC001759]